MKTLWEEQETNMKKWTLVLLALTTLALAATACQPAPAATPTPAQPASSPAAPATPKPTTMPVPTLSGKTPGKFEDIQRVTPEELKKLIEGKADLVVVDTQPKGAYDIGHVPGSVNFPWATEVKSGGDLPKDKLLVLYCACAHEEDAGDVAMQLITKHGYKNIMLLEGGWLKWVELNFPQEKQ